MRIWSVSCTLAVLLLAAGAAAQRRGSRRFSVTQASDAPAEDEEEIHLTRSHRFEGRRQSETPEDTSRTAGRGRSRSKDVEDLPNSRRPATRQRESSVDSSGSRQQSDIRRGKGLTFKSRSEPDVSQNERYLNTETRTRGRSDKEERRSSFSSRLDGDITSQSIETGTVRSQSSSNRNNNRENIRSRNEQNDGSRNAPTVDRRPLLPITSISPEDVTFPSRSRSRQTQPSEESLTAEPRTSLRNSQRTSSAGSKSRHRTTYPEQTLSSRSTATDSPLIRSSSRTRLVENERDFGTVPSLRARSDFSSQRRKPNSDLPGQDVESKLFSRRRNLTGGKVTPPDSDLNSKTVLPSTDEYKSTKEVTSDSSTQQSPLFTSIAETNSPGFEERIDPTTLDNKQIENGIDAVPTASNDALTLLPNEVLQSTLDVSDKSDKLIPQKETSKNYEDTSLTKALHARSRNRATVAPQEDESSRFSRGRSRQRSKEADVKSSRYTSRSRNTTPSLESPATNEKYNSRSRTSLTNRQSVTEQSVQDGNRSFRAKTRERLPSRFSSGTRETGGYSTESSPTSVSAINRGQGKPGTESSLPIESPVESLTPTSASRAGRRRTAETSGKPSRGRGQVKQGQLTDNEKGPSSGKDEDVSEDDNYPEVYKQLKKAGNGPKEILALLMAKKKQREAQQALRRQQQPPSAVETSTTAAFLTDLKTEEDNVKPSIESSVRRKQVETVGKETEQPSLLRSSARSPSRQRSLAFRSSREDNNLDLNKEISTKSYQSEIENSYQKQSEERKKNYSAKLRESNFNKDEKNENQTDKPIYRKNYYYKSLNDLGLDPKTLEPTEPTTERERFVPSSRRTKSYGTSTEEISEESQNTSTFKPRYQLYQAKNRKKYLDKKLSGKESLGSKEETDSNESVVEEEVGDSRTKKLRFGAASRPPYTPPRPRSTPSPTRGYTPAPRRPSRFTPRPERIEEQEPVTVQVFELEGRAPKLESASLVTESSSSEPSSSDASSTEGSQPSSSSEKSDSDDLSSTESLLDNSVIDDEPVIPLPKSNASATITTTTTTPKPTTTTTTPKPTATTTTTTSPKPTTTTTPKPATTTKPKPTTTTPKPTTTTTLKPTTTTTPKPTTTTTSKPTTTTTPKPTTTTTPKPTTTTTPKPTTTTTHKPSTTTTPKPTTTQKPTTNAQKLTTPKKPTTTKQPTTTTKKPNTTKKPQPPSAPKAPQNQTPLTSTSTTTEPSTTTDQLAARSNFIQKAEVSTVPEMILTSAQTFQPSTFGNIARSMDRPQTESSPDYVAYALLPNNTLVRRITARSTTPPTEVPFFVYGLFPNGTIVRRYPNGTVVPDDPSPESNELVAEVDPFNRQELSDILERDRPLAYLYPTTSTSSTSASTSKSSTEAISTTLSSTTLPTTVALTTTTTTTKKPPTTTQKPNITTKAPTKQTPSSTSISTTQAPTTTTTVAPKSTTTPKPMTTPKPKTTTPKLTMTSKPTTTTPKPTTTSKPTTTAPKPMTTPKSTTTTPKATTTPKQTTTTPKPTTTTQKSTTTTPKPTTTTPKSTTTTPKPTTTTPKPTTTTPKPTTTTKKPTTTTKIPTTTTKKPTTTTTTTTSIPASQSTTTLSSDTLESIVRSGVETSLALPETATPKDDEDCDTCDDDISSPSGPPSKDSPSNGLSDDDFALLNNLLRLQPSSSERSISADSSSPLPPSGPEDDDIANRIIQLAIERAQSSTFSPVSTEGLDLQLLSSSPEPSFEREGKSIVPPLGDSMTVESSPSPKPGGKISLWVVPDGETEQTTKAPQKLTPEDEQVLTALLAAPQSTSTISVRDQLLLAELLAAGQNNNQGIQISTTKRPRKKKRPTSTAPPPPPPTLNPLAALFGAGGRGGGLLGSGAAPPPVGSEEDGDGGARPQQGGLLVNAAINITRAVSQFMGLVLQSAAQSFQSFLASRTRNFADYVARGGAIS